MNRMTELDFRSVVLHQDLNVEFQEACQEYINLLEKADKYIDSQDKAISLLKDTRRISLIEGDPAVNDMYDQLESMGLSENYCSYNKAIRSEDSPDVAELTRAQGDFCKKIEPEIKECIKRLDQASKAQGYRNYLHARFNVEGISVYSFNAWLKAIESIAIRSWNDLMHMKNPSNMPSFSIGNIVQEQMCNLPTINFSISDIEKLVSTILGMFGILDRRGPISIHLGDIKFPCGFYAVDPGKDIRIALSNNLSGYRLVWNAIVELGHAIYFLFCPKDTQIFLDSNLCQHVIACTVANLTKDSIFVEKVFGFSAQENQEFRKSVLKYDRFGLLNMTRSARFAFEAFNNPDQSFPELWSRITLDLFGLPDDSGCFELYDFIQLTASKNRLVGTIMSGKVYKLVTSRFDTLARPEAFEYFRERFIESGAMSLYMEKFGLGLPE